MSSEPRQRVSTASVGRSLEGRGPTTSALTLDLLAWIDSRTRSYEETIEAWKTSCPRLSIWDDAVIDGFVRIERRSGRGAIVALTALGQTTLRQLESEDLARP
jgi:hypothetical protein